MPQWLLKLISGTPNWNSFLTRGKGTVRVSEYEKKKMRNAVIFFYNGGFQENRFLDGFLFFKISPALYFNNPKLSINSINWVNKNQNKPKMGKTQFKLWFLTSINQISEKKNLFALQNVKNDLKKIESPIKFHFFPL